jgi:membrane-associated phospholipid phosphatase
MSLKNFLFWQPKQSLLKLACRSKTGEFLLVFLNYLIWFFLVFLSFKLVKKDANIFWQLFLSTFIAETVERFSKSFLFWSRPICKYKYLLPKGLVKNWYNTGSFPSGHTSKAVFFLLYSIQYAVFPQNLYLLITVPLLVFRVLVGFHYPIDILGGIFIGFVSWQISHNIVFPQAMVDLVESIFSIFFK